MWFGGGVLCVSGLLSLFAIDFAIFEVLPSKTYGCLAAPTAWVDQRCWVSE